MSSPIQRRAWKKLTEIPAGQRTAAVCRMVCEYKGQQELLDAVRQTIRQELRGVQLTKEEAQDKDSYAVNKKKKKSREMER